MRATFRSPSVLSVSLPGMCLVLRVADIPRTTMMLPRVPMKPPTQVTRRMGIHIRKLHCRLGRNQGCPRSMTRIGRRDSLLPVEVIPNIVKCIRYGQPTNPIILGSYISRAWVPRDLRLRLEPRLPPSRVPLMHRMGWRDRTYKCTVPRSYFCVPVFN
jgi:hypothetical protein